MRADFDTAATTYDKVFTDTFVGRSQRNRVWEFLSPLLEGDKKRILEINCGTGEDAQYFAEIGHSVLATDISHAMVEVAQMKNEYKNLRFAQCDFRELALIDHPHKYDLIFSNFGGLNCISKEVLQKEISPILSNLLAPKGKFVAVIMPDRTFLESLYFLMKGRKTEAFRRSKDSLDVVVEGEIVKTWYFSPKEFRDCFKDKFELQRIKPIGLFIPPSYLNFLVENKRLLEKTILFFEKLFARFAWQARYSDHSYIQFQKK